MPTRARAAAGLLCVTLVLSCADTAAAQTSSSRQAGAPAAPASASAAAAFKPDQAVEVREGDEWSPATFVKREGRKLQVRYADGTEEWVTADRLRHPGAAGAPAAANADADANPAAADATKAPGKAAANDAFAIGAKVEVKSTARWKPATVKNRDGDLYLIVYDDRPEQFWWEWVHPGIIRKAGSAKDWHDWGRGVGVRNSGVAKAKEEARRQFANIDAEAAAAAARGDKKDPFAPLAYDKPVTDVNLDKVDDLLPTGGPAKLAAFDPAPANVKPAERGYVLKGKGSRWHSGGPAAVFFAGPRAVAAYTNDGMGADSRTTSLEFLDLANGSSLGLIDADPLSLPVDLSPSGQRTVGIQHGFHSGTRTRVDLHTVAPSGKQAQHLVSFVPYPGESTWKDVDLARFIGGGDDHVLTANRGGSLILWDAPKATAVWRVKLPQGATPAVSPGGRQVAFVDDGGALVVLDALGGKVLCRIEGERVVQSLAFSPDGKRVVGVSGASVVTWDLEQGKALPDIGLPLKSAGGKPLALDGRFVLIGGADVLDLDKKVVVWRYNAPPAHGDGSLRVHGGRCWRVVVDDGRPVLTSAKLPHDAARKAADGVALAQGLLVQPGSRVALAVAIDAPADQQQRITAAITDQLARAGIKVDPASPIKLNARTEQGKTTQQTYEVRQFGRPSGGPFGRSTETVSVTEKITRVFFEVDGQVAWESRTSSGGAPMFVMAREGQTVNEAVQAGSRFNLAFLESVRVPAYAPRPSETPWLGESTWGLAGVGKDRLTAQPAARAARAGGDGLD